MKTPSTRRWSPEDRTFSWLGGLALLALVIGAATTLMTIDEAQACNPLIDPYCVTNGGQIARSPIAPDVGSPPISQLAEWAQDPGDPRGFVPAPLLPRPIPPPPPPPPTPQEIIQQTLSHGHLQTPPPRTCTTNVTYVYGVLITTVVCH